MQLFQAPQHSELSDVYCCRQVHKGEMMPCSFRMSNLFGNASRAFCQLSCSKLNLNVKLGCRAQSIHDLLEEVVSGAEDQVE